MILTAIMKTAYDLFDKANLPEIVETYSKGALRGTKKMTDSELEIMKQTPLAFLVYWPGMMDEVEKVATAHQKLSSMQMDWDNLEHVMFAVHCLPILTAPLLPQRVFAEGNTVTWIDRAINQPAVSASRACH